MIRHEADCKYSVWHIRKSKSVIYPVCTTSNEEYSCDQKTVVYCDYIEIQQLAYVLPMVGQVQKTKYKILQAAEILVEIW